jgi:hypothetical protein
MPRIFNNLLIASLFAWSLGSCQSHESSADDAFERVKEGKMMRPMGEELMDTQPIVAGKPTLKTHIVEASDPWAQFKKGMETKILANQVEIVALKARPNNSKGIKKVIALEEENNELRLQMEAYHVQELARWAEFEARMKLNVEGIATALKELKPPAK